MAINRGTSTTVLATEERTYRVECDAPDGSTYSIRFYREQISRDADGKVAYVNRNLPTVVRTLDQLKTANDPGLELFVKLRDHGDRWAQQDASTTL